MKRSERLVLFIRPGEEDDLRTLSEAWETSVSGAAWALLSDRLGELRGAAPIIQGSNPGALIVAASRLIVNAADHIQRDPDGSGYRRKNG
jgi:hypothetical protein